jgi:hypothetical protein
MASTMAIDQPPNWWADPADNSNAPENRPKNTLGRDAAARVQSVAFLSARMRRSGSIAADSAGRSATSSSSSTRAAKRLRWIAPILRP